MQNRGRTRERCRSREAEPETQTTETEVEKTTGRGGPRRPGRRGRPGRGGRKDGPDGGERRGPGGSREAGPAGAGRSSPAFLLPTPRRPASPSGSPTPLLLLLFLVLLPPSSSPSSSSSSSSSSWPTLSLPPDRRRRRRRLPCPNSFVLLPRRWRRLPRERRPAKSRSLSLYRQDVDVVARASRHQAMEEKTAPAERRGPDSFAPCRLLPQKRLVGTTRGRRPDLPGRRGTAIACCHCLPPTPASLRRSPRGAPPLVTTR